MRRLILKLSCIFIITMFCLAPLSATDFTDNNTDSNKTDSNNTEIDEIEIMDDTINTTINSTNETETITTVDNNSNIKAIHNISNSCNSEINNVNTTVKNLSNKENESEILGEPANLRVSINDINVDQEVVVEIYANEKLEGYHVNLALWKKEWASADDVVIFTKKITLGKGYTKYVVPCSLPAGEYGGFCNWGGKPIWEADDIPGETVDLDFSIKKYEPNLRVNVENSTLTNRTYVFINGDTHINDYVTVKTNNSDTTYSVKLTNGVGMNELEYLPVGNYLVTANYAGDDLFESKEITEEFTIEGVDHSKKPVQNMKNNILKIGVNAPNFFKKIK